MYDTVVVATRERLLNVLCGYLHTPCEGCQMVSTTHQGIGYCFRLPVLALVLSPRRTKKKNATQPNLILIIRLFSVANTHPPAAPC